jgi:hypothetical protein
MLSVMCDGKKGRGNRMGKQRIGWGERARLCTPSLSESHTSASSPKVAESRIAGDSLSIAVNTYAVECFINPFSWDVRWKPIYRACHLSSNERSARDDAQERRVTSQRARNAIRAAVAMKCPTCATKLPQAALKRNRQKRPRVQGARQSPG